MLLFAFTQARADIPRMINFQGVLKDTLGSPVPDGNYSMTFRIYDASGGGTVFWQEGKLIPVVGGLFTTLLGSASPIPESVFADTSRWLGVQIGGDPEISSRTRLAAISYAYVADFAQNADKLDDMNSADFALSGHTHPTPDTVNFAQKADTANLSLNSDLLDGISSSDFAPATHNHDAVYVNVTGPDSVVLSDTGAAFRGRSSGSAAQPSIGIDGIATNTLGGAFGGRFNASSSGVGNPIGVDGTGSSSTSNSAYGGYFRASGGGATYITGVVGLTNSSSTNQTVASYGQASNSSTGTAYGGYFQALSGGTGSHFGVYGVGYSESPAITYGSYGLADNTSSGLAYGGWFQTSSSGTGQRFGVQAYGTGSSSSPVYGCAGFASNTSTGTAYGGRFDASSSGTGVHYGVFGMESAGGSGAAVYAAGDMIASGAKPAVVKTAQGHRLLYAMESPEVWFEDFGEGQMVNGQSHIELDPLFLETVTINASNPMKVFIQLNDDCKGVYVKTQTTGFDVFELQSGTSNAAFTYRLVAKRKGYETQRLMQTDVGMDDPNLYPELWEKMEKEQQDRQAEMEKARIQE